MLQHYAVITMALPQNHAPLSLLKTQTLLTKTNAGFLRNDSQMNTSQLKIQNNNTTILNKIARVTRASQQ
jgi:hypothetical protein